MKAYGEPMSETYRIAEVARKTGFTPSTLRYYEQLGLIPAPCRTLSGYRAYDDAALARLAFVARAKQLGCTLEEITDLVAAWQEDRCEPVQDRLRDLVDGKIAAANDRIAALGRFAAELRDAADALGRHTPAGPCDPDCGCAAPVDVRPPGPAAPLTAGPPAAVDPPLGCTLPGSEMDERRAAWQRALAPVVGREAIDDGVRLALPPGESLGVLADLVVAEQRCCSFLRFAITVDDRGSALEVTASGGRGEMVARFGDRP